MSDDATQTIKAIFGPEPMREGEYVNSAQVGFCGVTRIELREKNMGSYGIDWLDVYKGDELAASFNAMHVAIVLYAEPPK